MPAARDIICADRCCRPPHLTSPTRARGLRVDGPKKGQVFSIGTMLHLIEAKRVMIKRSIPSDWPAH